MTSSIATYLTVAVVLNGLLAGINVDRALVQMPAWRRVGARAWATYSRHADLGNGLWLYPLEAIGGTLFTLAAAIAFRFDIGAPYSARFPIDLTVGLAFGGLLMTVVAAPKMLSLKRIGDDPAALQRAFEGFQRWGGVRGMFQVLAFGANLWALIVVLRQAPGFS